MTTPSIEDRPESSSNKQLSVQQQLVLEQRYKALELHNQTGDHLDGKALALLQAGSLIIGLSSAVSIPTFIYRPPNLWALVGIVVAFVAYGTMLLMSLKAWMPAKTAIPGENDWDKVFENYLYEDPTTCFNKVLSDLIKAIDLLLNRNADKARLVRWSTWLLAVQIAGILVLAFF